MDHHVIHINMYDYTNLYMLNVRTFNSLDSRNHVIFINLPIKSLKRKLINISFWILILNLLYGDLYVLWLLAHSLHRILFTYKYIHTVWGELDLLVIKSSPLDNYL